MKTAMNIVKVAAAAISALVVGQAFAADTDVFAGFSSASRSKFAYVGGIKAMNGDLEKNGLLLRGMIFSGRYDYDTVGVASGKVDGKLVGAELGVGYQWFNPGSRFSLYGGIDHPDHDLSPDDPGNKVKGSKTGAQVQAEIETRGSPLYGNLIAKYSSAWGSYWVRGRAGYTFGSVVVGPEAIGMGSESFKEHHYGLFLAVPVSKATSLSLSAGHRTSTGKNARADQTGSYVDLGFDVKF